MAPPGGPSFTEAGWSIPALLCLTPCGARLTLRSLSLEKKHRRWVVVLHASSPSERLSEHSVAGSEREQVGLGETEASIHSKGFT